MGSVRIVNVKVTDHAAFRAAERYRRHVFIEEIEAEVAQALEAGWSTSVFDIQHVHTRRGEVYVVRVRGDQAVVATAVPTGG